MSRPIKTMRLPIKTMIDLNADVAEGSGTEEQLAPFCTSWNLCCGAHAGGPEAIRFALELARQFNIHCGVHPGHADKANFGRVIRKLNRHDLRQLIVPQLGMDEQGRLLPREAPGGVLFDPTATAKQALGLAQSGRIRTLCVHGDSPNASLTLKAARNILLENHFLISPP